MKADSHRRADVALAAIALPTQPRVKSISAEGFRCGQVSSGDWSTVGVEQFGADLAFTGHGIHTQAGAGTDQGFRQNAAALRSAIGGDKAVLAQMGQAKMTRRWSVAP